MFKTFSQVQEPVRRTERQASVKAKKKVADILYDESSNDDSPSDTSPSDTSPSDTSPSDKSIASDINSTTILKDSSSFSSKHEDENSSRAKRGRYAIKTYVGVSYCAEYKKWRAECKGYIGQFTTEEIAARACDVVRYMKNDDGKYNFYDSLHQSFNHPEIIAAFTKRGVNLEPHRHRLAQSFAAESSQKHSPAMIFRPVNTTSSLLSQPVTSSLVIPPVIDFNAVRSSTKTPTLNPDGLEQNLDLEISEFLRTATPSRW